MRSRATSYTSTYPFSNTNNTSTPSKPPDNFLNPLTEIDSSLPPLPPWVSSSKSNLSELLERFDDRKKIPRTARVFGKEKKNGDSDVDGYYGEGDVMRMKGDDDGDDCEEDHAHDEMAGRNQNDNNTKQIQRERRRTKAMSTMESKRKESDVTKPTTMTTIIGSSSEAGNIDTFHDDDDENDTSDDEPDDGDGTTTRDVNDYDDGVLAIQKWIRWGYGIGKGVVGRGLGLVNNHNINNNTNSNNGDKDDGDGVAVVDSEKKKGRELLIREGIDIDDENENVDEYDGPEAIEDASFPAIRKCQKQKNKRNSNRFPSSSSSVVVAPSSPLYPGGLNDSREMIHVKRRKNGAKEYLGFVWAQASTLLLTTLSHSFLGPPKPSWSLTLTLFTTLVRSSSSSYSHLSNFSRLRRICSLGGIVYSGETDGVVTPVGWKVVNLRLRGDSEDGSLLKDWEEKEFVAGATTLSSSEENRDQDHRHRSSSNEGKSTIRRKNDITKGRQLTGEWVVCKKVWRRMQLEWKEKERRKKERERRENNKWRDSSHHRRQNGLFRRRHQVHPHHPLSSPPVVVAPKELQHNNHDDGLIFLYIHGGAFFAMSASTHRYITISLSRHTSSRIFSTNYRLAPDQSHFPGQLQDVISAYFRLIRTLKISNERIVLAGDSAGGGLALALLMYLRDEGYEMPLGAVLMSPWCDLTMSMGSWESNAKYDYLTLPPPDSPLHPVRAYLGPQNFHRYLTHPYASPLFGKFHNLPPLLIQVGDSEVLLDEIALLAHKASLATTAEGGDTAKNKVRYEVYKDCVHVFQGFWWLSESKRSFENVGKWVREVLGPERRERREKSEGGEKREDWAERKEELEERADKVRTRIRRNQRTDNNDKSNRKGAGSSSPMQRSHQEENTPSDKITRETISRDDQDLLLMDMDLGMDDIDPDVDADVQDDAGEYLVSKRNSRRSRRKSRSGGNGEGDDYESTMASKRYSRRSGSLS